MEQRPTMATKKSNKVFVLRGCQSFLRKAFLCNRNGIDIVWMKIPRWFGNFTFIFVMSLMISMFLGYSIDKHFDMKTTFFSLSLALGFFQMLMIYISLVIRNHNIIDTINDLQQLIDNSE